MALPNNVDTLDEVEEKYHSFYVENDGKFELDKNLQSEDVSALKNAKEAEKADKARLQKELDKIATEKEQWAIREAELKGETEKAERLKQEALDRQKADYERQNREKLTSLEKRIHELTVGKLKSEIASQVYLKPEVMDLKFLSDRIKLDEKDDAFVVDSNGASMEVADLIAELRNDESMAMFIKGGDGQGGGSSGKRSSADMSKGGNKMQQKKALLKSKFPNLA